MIDGNGSVSVLPTAIASNPKEKWKTLGNELLRKSIIKLSEKTVRLVVAIALIAMPFLGLAFVRVQQLSLSYRIARLEDQRLALEEKKRVLELEVAVRKRPERIKRIVRDKLSLQMPKPNRVIRLHEAKGKSS